MKILRLLPKNENLDVSMFALFSTIVKLIEAIGILLVHGNQFNCQKVTVRGVFCMKCPQLLP
jgi:predicted membrane protein